MPNRFSGSQSSVFVGPGVVVKPTVSHRNEKVLFQGQAGSRMSICYPQWNFTVLLTFGFGTYFTDIVPILLLAKHSQCICFPVMHGLGNYNIFNMFLSCHLRDHLGKPKTLNSHLLRITACLLAVFRSQRWL